MTNKERYQNMENEIHVPSEVLGKVMSMKKENIKKRNIVKSAASIAAAFAIVFVVSNGICYAASGNTWIEKATVYINGESKEVDIHYQQDENGNEIGTMTLELDDEADDVRGEVTLGNSGETGSEQCTLTGKDGKVYLVLDPADFENSSLDITEDIVDGKAEGDMEVSGQKYHYEVFGTLEDYQINLEKK